jgi:hypothetical protein
MMKNLILVHELGQGLASLGLPLDLRAWAILYNPGIPLVIAK